MPVATPADVWSFAGVALQADIMRVRALDGFTAVPPLRGTGFVRSAIAGEMFRGKIHGARVIGLEILLFSRDSDPFTGEPDLGPIFDNLDTLAKVFNTQYQTEQPLVQVHPKGSVRTAMAHCVGWNPKMSDDNTGSLYSGVAEFLMSDPYFYTPQETVTLAPVSGYVLNHPGTVRTHRIQFVFHTAGGFTTPTIVNHTNGVSFQVLPPAGSSSGAHTLIVDCKYFTCTLDGTNVVGSLIHSGDLPFMVFKPGNNTLDISGCDSVDINWYPAYI